jgi:hypothetical protein
MLQVGHLRGQPMCVACNTLFGYTPMKEQCPWMHLMREQPSKGFML